MKQSRVNSGALFEVEIGKRHNLLRKPVSPKIIWNGTGRTNLDKIVSINFDETKFFPTEKSKYLKYDVTDKKNNTYEVKSYTIDSMYSWKLYSEPIVKVATKNTLNRVTTLFGNGDVNKGILKYNDFINKLFIHMSENGGLNYIQNEMTKHTKGIFFRDQYVDIMDISFRWVILKNQWAGFDRITLEFMMK